MNSLILKRHAYSTMRCASYYRRLATQKLEDDSELLIYQKDIAIRCFYFREKRDLPSVSFSIAENQAT